MKHGKLVIAGTVATTLVLAAGGWFLGVQPFLAAASASDAELAGVLQLNDMQATRLAELQAAGERVDSLRSDLAELQVEIPTDPAMADLLGELAVIEARTGARVTGVTSGTPTLIGSSDAAPADAGAEGAAAAVEPLVPIAGMQAMPVTLTASGSASAVRAFLAGLQGDGRLISMSGVTFSTDPADQSSRVDINGSVYVVPEV